MADPGTLLAWRCCCAFVDALGTVPKSTRVAQQAVATTTTTVVVRTHGGFTLKTTSQFPVQQGSGSKGSTATPMGTMIQAAEFGVFAQGVFHLLNGQGSVLPVRKLNTEVTVYLAVTNHQ